MRIISTLGIVAVALLGAAACKNKIDNPDAEKKLKAWAEENIAPVSKVTCPQAEMKAGTSFECSVAFTGAATFKVRVDMKDDKGNVEWAWVVQPMSGKVAADMIAEGLKAQAPDVKVDCGDGVFEMKPEGLECKATAQGETVPFVFKLEGDQFTWEPKK
jgi:hypothetical protein